MPATPTDAPTILPPRGRSADPGAPGRLPGRRRLCHDHGGRRCRRARGACRTPVRSDRGRRARRAAAARRTVRVPTRITRRAAAPPRAPRRSTRKRRWQRSCIGSCAPPRKRAARRPPSPGRPAAARTGRTSPAGSRLPPWPAPRDGARRRSRPRVPALILRSAARADEAKRWHRAMPRARAPARRMTMLRTQGVTAIPRGGTSAARSRGRPPLVRVAPDIAPARHRTVTAQHPGDPPA